MLLLSLKSVKVKNVLPFFHSIQYMQGCKMATLVFVKLPSELQTENARTQNVGRLLFMLKANRNILLYF